MSWHKRREESGAQLLARLVGRPELTAIDPMTFGPSTASDTSWSSSSLHSPKPNHKIIELYGSEGVGKSELALHYVAKCCLRKEWKGIRLGGLEAKAQIIDTDFKFCVLRLAIILEKLILQKLTLIPNDDENKSHESNDDYHTNREVEPNDSNLLFSHVEKRLTDTPCPSGSGNICNEATSLSSASTSSPKLRSSETHNGLDVGLTMKISRKRSNGRNEKTDREIRDLEASHELDGLPSHPAKTLKLHDDISDVRSGSLDTESDALTADDRKCKRKTFVSAEDVEEIVQDCLGRVFVVRASNSHQLCTTLMSLSEQDSSTDSGVSLVLIDSITSFFWQDKLLNDGTAVKGSSSWNINDLRPISLIASAITKCVSQLGLTFLITKAALLAKSSSSLSTSRRGNGFGFQPNRSTDIDSCEERFEFLGKAWSNLNPRRMFLHREAVTCDSNENNAEVILKCSEWSKPRKFRFCDDSLTFL